MRAQVLQATVSYTATFARPAYEFVTRWGDLFAAIGRHFSALGVQPADIRFESPSGQPHQFELACYIYRVEASVRFRLASFEAWAKGLFRAEAGVAVWEAATAVTKELIPEMSLASQATLVQGHVQVDGGSADMLLSRMMAGADWARPAGARYLVSLGDGMEATVDLAPSLVQPGPNNVWGSGAFAFPGTLDVSEVASRSARYVDEILRRAAVDLGGVTDGH